MGMPRPIKFVTSISDIRDLPPPGKPEIALAGRSNAGKSSFINSLANQTVAKVSQKPGKTRLLNFFSVGEGYVLVDMPGYGYASRSGDEIRTWQALVEGYLGGRESLRGVVLFMDSKRDWEENEELLVQFLNGHQVPWALALTKSDRLSKADMSRKVKELRRRFVGVEVFVISAQTSEGVDELEETLFKKWVKKK